MKAFVTGCAGFIRSNLIDRLLLDGHHVVGIDNLSTGQVRFLHLALTNPRFELVRGDLLDEQHLASAMSGCEMIFHFAANADVRFGTSHPRRDLEQNTIATSNVLEAMRTNGIKRIAFSSTGSVYSEAKLFPTPEDAPFPVQTSLYGASKLACEGLIAAYCEGFGFQSWILRFVSILGERYTHGHVFDFYKHFLPAKRLTLSSFKKTWYGTSISSPIITLYYREVVFDRYKRKLLKYIYGKWYLYILTIGIQFCRGLLLCCFGNKETRRIRCLMEIQQLKGKYIGMVRIGASGFREIARNIDKLKIK